MFANYMLFCYQNCSDLLLEKMVLVIEKKLKSEAEGREFANVLRTEYFLTCSWRFLSTNELKQSEFKLQKNIGIYRHAGEVRKF